jgi:hypothetical protein
MQRRHFLKKAACLAAAATGHYAEPAQLLETAMGPLRVHPDNPRYFTDGSGRAIYLTGSHTWANLQDTGVAPEPISIGKAIW